VISGNKGGTSFDDGVGVYIGDICHHNVIVGNYIGVDATGTTALGNDYGLLLQYSVSDNVIGGTTVGERNVISGNNLAGVRLDTQTGTRNIVRGNYVGLGTNGVTALPNGRGVDVWTGTGNTIGGDQPGEGNTIFGNTNEGIRITSSGTVTYVMGNYISGNGSHGVYVNGGSAIIGGLVQGQGNTIASNGGDGVNLYQGSGTIHGNSIHENGGKGIELYWNQPPPPIIDSAGGGVSGHTSPKCYPCTVEVFSDDEDEGRIYQGSVGTNDDAMGTWTYNVTVIGPNVTATVTDNVGTGNTSEFSAPMDYSSPAVGGIAELPDVAASDSSARNHLALAGLAAAALLALTAGAWYARRRWGR
jgi:hypothetical protein